MPKVFSPNFPAFLIGPPPSKGPLPYYQDEKYWKARQSYTMNLREYFYNYYRAIFKLDVGTISASYESTPYDLGPYCKKMIMTTTITKFTIEDTFPTESISATIFNNMCGKHTGWEAFTTVRYKITNSPLYPSDNRWPDVRISDIVRNPLNCYPDYDIYGKKIGDNPDNYTYDYTAEVRIKFYMEILPYAYFNLETMKVWPNIYFYGLYASLDWPNPVDPPNPNDPAYARGYLTVAKVTIKDPSAGLKPFFPDPDNIYHISLKKATAFISLSWHGKDQLELMPKLA